MNHYLISSNLIWITILLLVAFIIFSRRRSTLIHAFIFYMISIAAWGFGWSKMAAATDPINGMFWARALHVGAAIIPSAFLNFTLSINPKDPSREWRQVTRTGYALSIFFLLICFSKYFVSHTANVSDIAFFPQRGPLYDLYIAFFAAYTILSFWSLIKTYRHGSDKTKIQARYVFIAFALAWMGGCPAFLPLFGIRIWPYSFYGVVLCVLILTYAVLARQLLNLRIVVRRVVLFTGIYTALVLSVIPLVLRLHRHLLLNNGTIGTTITAEVIVISIIFSMGPFLYAYFARRGSYFKEQTIAGLTHELKSPIATIQNAIEFLRSDMPEAIQNGKRAEYLDMIERNSNRLTLFTNDLLNAFNHDHRAILNAQEPVDLRQVIQKIADHYQDRTGAHAVALSIELPSVPVTAAVDAQKIEQVVSNLLSNAIKFGQNNPIHVKLERRDADAFVSVNDHGPGIAHEDIPRVFDRFYQGKNSGGKRGTGLGLTIAKMWVEAHGGQIWAESEGEGKGTSVAFTLPIDS